MKLSLTPSSLNGTVHVIASKSLSHRYLIAAALSKEPSILEGLMESDDIDATKHALKALGAIIESGYVKGGFPNVRHPEINARASGSTVRFMIPIAMVSDKPVVFRGEHRLPKRSLAAYETMFTSMGYRYERLSEDHLPLRVQGPLKPGNYHIRGDVSSQFITGLLFALPLLEGDSRIVIEGDFQSQSYVGLTVDTLNAFSIEVNRTDSGYFIPGNQVYQPLHVNVEGDYSQAAFFIVAALMNRYPLRLDNLRRESKQGDRRILSIIAGMGGRYEWDQDTLVVHPSTTRGTTIDLADIPDLGPILMVLAARSEGETTFTNVQRLRYKESDRVEAMREVLTAFGVFFEATDDTVTVKGATTFKGDITLDSYDDHRIAMAVIIASLNASGPVTLKNAEAINKSYPNFVDVFKTLGGSASIFKEGDAQ